MRTIFPTLFQHVRQAEDVDVHFALLATSVQLSTVHAPCRGKRLDSFAAEDHREAVRGPVGDRGMSKADVAALLQVSQRR